MAEFSGVSLKSLQYTPSPTETKGLVQPGSTGAATVDPALVQWFEQANAYYNAVMAGDPETPRPTEMEWNDFLAQLQWAQTTLGYGTGMGMGGTLGGMPGGLGAPQLPQSNQFGGMLGPDGQSYVYTEASATIGFTGNGTNRIWSNDVTLDVAPVSAHVSISMTTDTTIQPNAEVLKVVITDPATGTETVNLIYDFDPTKDTLKINTPEESQITSDTTGFADGVIEWGEFTPGGSADPSAKPDASIPGEEISENTFRYEPEFAGETINFFANPNEPGVTQTAVIYADANISVKPSDEVNIEGPDANGVVTVTVTHNKGSAEESTDVYQVQKGYNVNINQKAEYISEGGTLIGEDGIDSEDLKERVTLNGETSTSTAEGALDPEAIVSGLLEDTERNEAQLMSALEAAGYDFEDIEAFKEAVANEEFPGTIDNKLLDFLSILDADFKEALEEYEQKVADGKPDSEKAGAMEDANDRLVELLGKLFPNAIVSAGNADQNGGGFSINGDDYSWTDSGGAVSVSIE